MIWGISPRQYFYKHSSSRSFFFVCLIVNEKQSLFWSKRSNQEFICPTYSHNCKQRQFLKKKKKRGFLRQLSDRVAFVLVRDTKHHDVCSLWYALLLIKYVLFIPFGSDYNNEMRWKVMVGGKQANEKKLDSQTGIFSSTNVYRRISLSCLFWVNFIFVIDWGEIELPLFRVLDTPSL